MSIVEVDFSSGDPQVVEVDVDGLSVEVDASSAAVTDIELGGGQGPPGTPGTPGTPGSPGTGGAAGGFLIDLTTKIVDEESVPNTWPIEVNLGDPAVVPGTPAAIVLFIPDLDDSEGADNTLTIDGPDPTGPPRRVMLIYTSGLPTVSWGEGMYSEGPDAGSGDGFAPYPPMWDLSPVDLTGFGTVWIVTRVIIGADFDRLAKLDDDNDFTGVQTIESQFPDAAPDDSTPIGDVIKRSIIGKVSGKVRAFIASIDRRVIGGTPGAVPAIFLPYYDDTDTDTTNAILITATDLFGAGSPQLFFAYAPTDQPFGGSTLGATVVHADNQGDGAFGSSATTTDVAASIDSLHDELQTEIDAKANTSDIPDVSALATEADLTALAAQLAALSAGLLKEVVYTGVDGFGDIRGGGTFTVDPFKAKTGIDMASANRGTVLFGNPGPGLYADVDVNIDSAPPGYVATTEIGGLTDVHDVRPRPIFPSYVMADGNFIADPDPADGKSTEVWATGINNPQENARNLRCRIYGTPNVPAQPAVIRTLGPFTNGGDFTGTPVNFGVVVTVGGGGSQNDVTLDTDYSGNDDPLDDIIQAINTQLGDLAQISRIDGSAIDDATFAVTSTATGADVFAEINDADDGAVANNITDGLNGTGVDENDSPDPIVLVATTGAFGE